MSSFFFFNDTATTEIYTLSLHDALPISVAKELYLSPATVATHVSHVLEKLGFSSRVEIAAWIVERRLRQEADGPRSEEHTSELQSRLHLVCRLLLEKKKNIAPSA